VKSIYKGHINAIRFENIMMVLEELIASYFKMVSFLGRKRAYHFQDRQKFKVWVHSDFSLCFYASKRHPVFHTNFQISLSSYSI